jgi:hypothetical protein
MGKINAKWVSMEFTEMIESIKGFTDGKIEDNIIEHQIENQETYKPPRMPVKPLIIRFELGKIEDITQISTGKNSFKEASLEVENINIFDDKIEIEVLQTVAGKQDIYSVIYNTRYMLKYSYGKIPHKRSQVQIATA